MDVDGSSTLDKGNALFYTGAVVVAFYTLFSTSSLLLWVLWALGGGVLAAYILLKLRKRAPNILIHLKATVPPQGGDGGKVASCPICGNTNCSRHRQPQRRGLVMPWETLLVASTVDKALQELLEDILNRFIDQWHMKLTTSSLFTNELRRVIRHAISLFMLRAQKVDIPKVVTGPLLQVAVHHIHTYLTVRRSLPSSASQCEIEEAVMAALGSRVHPAVRGHTTNQRYFKNLVRQAGPLLLPSTTSGSRVMMTFLEELFANKVMMLAMDYVSKPDFINKILAMVFDKESKLTRVVGPLPHTVLLLERFARQRNRERLQPSVNNLIRNHKMLYSFMQFLKARGVVYLLQFYLDCDDLKKKISKSATSIDALSQYDKAVELYQQYMTGSGQDKISFDSALLEDIHHTLYCDLPVIDRVQDLQERRLLDKASVHVTVLLEESFCMSFYHSREYHAAMMPSLTANRRRSTMADSHSLNKHFERWQASRSRSSTMLPSSTSSSDIGDTSRQQPQAVRGGSSPQKDHTPTPSSSHPASRGLEDSSTFSLPNRVNVIDWKVVNESMGIKSYATYIIMTWHQATTERKASSTKVERRYKEFCVLDSRLRQFCKSMPCQLPAKRAFNNMGKAFIDQRALDLHKYLQALVQHPEVQRSRLLSSFLSEQSDEFMPDSVKDRAGKFIKTTVPGILKADSKAQYVEPFLFSLQAKASSPPHQPDEDKMMKTREIVESNKNKVQRYREELFDDLSAEGKHWLRAPSVTGDEVPVTGVMDLLVYLAVDVYGVSRGQLIVLLCMKLLGQESIETFVHYMLSCKVDLTCQESKLVELIELLHKNLFYDKSPPRTDADYQKRREDTLHTILSRPPSILVDVIGRDTFTDTTTLLYEGLQSKALNKQLLFSLLDVVVLELFPELQTN